MLSKSRFNLSALGTVVFSGATLMSGVVLSSASVKADVIDDVSITIPVSCSFIGSPDEAHSATINAGTYASDIGTTNFKVTCNDNTGYSIYAIGYSNNEYGNNKMLATINNELAPTYDISTGTNTSGANSAWAMKLIPVSGTYAPTIENGYNNYNDVPSVYTKVATFASNTDYVIGSNLQSTYQVYIDSTKPAGTYNGKVKYTMVHPASEAPLQPQTTDPGYIAYYPNASTAVGSMSTSTGGPVQQLTASQTSATLLASNFSRAGYGFAGWNDAYDYSGNYYGPNEDITFTAGQYSGSNNGLSLYAVWVKSAGTFQSDATTVCNSLTQAPASGTPTMASVSALTDERDNQTYAIAKLADGNCWMIENLRLESEDTISAEDEALSQGYGKYSGTGTDYGDFIGLADAESTGFSSTYSANSLYSNDGSDDTENIGTSNYPAYRMPRYNHFNTDSTSASPTRATSLTASTSYTTTASANIYSYGNYYTWHAAIANTNYNGTNNQSTTGTSLCPAGWHLPTGGSVTTAVNVTETPSTWREFYNLGYGIMGSVANDSNAGTNAYYNNTTTNSNGDTATKAFRKFPNNFLYSGYFGTSSAVNRGTYGYYWSSTAYNNYYSYYLNLSSSSVYPGTSYNLKDYGRSIRCVSGT